MPPLGQAPPLRDIMPPPQTSFQTPDRPDIKGKAQAYWSRNPNALKHGGGAEPGTREFVASLARHRYDAEPCIEEMACFEASQGLVVLEVGCGFGVDLSRFASAGARVTAIDFSSTAAPLAKEHLRAQGLEGEVSLGDSENLPFPDATFDLVWSHGVIHHSPETERAAREILRVLKPGGRAVVMVYHRNSYLYRVLAPLMVAPATLLVLGLRKAGLGRFARLVMPLKIHQVADACRARGFRLSRIRAICTDSAYQESSLHNPLSRFFSRRDGVDLFAGAARVDAHVRQLYRFPAPRALKRILERRWGMFVYYVVEKGAT